MISDKLGDMANAYFWKKSIFIAAISFILGGLAGLFFSKVFFLKPSGFPFEVSAPQTKETEKLPEINFQKIVAGEFSPVPETNASPKILSIKEAVKEGEEHVITAFDPQTWQSSRLFIPAICCGGALYQGSLEPLLSSTHKRIAYIDENDKNVWIADSNGENKVRISSQGLVETKDVWGTMLFLSGWSSNEEWLVYYVEISDEGMGVNPEDKLPPPVIEGFYAANLKEGKVYLLPNLPNFVDFLPQSGSVVFVKEQREEKQADLYAQELVTGGVKKLTQESIKGTFAGQFSFSNDGHFTYTVGDTELSFSKLIYVSLDNRERREIAEGRWAEVQFPKISPDGALIAYERHIPANCPDGGGGCPQASLIVYNLKNSQEKNFGPIKNLLYWFNDKQIIVLGGRYSRPWSLQIIDSTTGERKMINENEELRSW